MVKIHVYTSEGEVLSAGAVAGIAVTVTLLLALPVGVVICLGVAWYGKRRAQGPTSEGDQHKSQQVQEAIYGSHQRLPYLSVTTRPMATLTCRGRTDIIII